MSIFEIEEMTIDKILDAKAKRKKEVDSKNHNNRPHRGGAVKNDAAKPRMSLIPQLALIEIANVMTHGAEKYAAYNWLDGFDFSKLCDAAQRHLTAFNCGENIDPDSGFHHLAHLGCCAMMLYDITQLYPELDDRWEGWKEEKFKKVYEHVMGKKQGEGEE